MNVSSFACTVLGLLSRPEAMTLYKTHSYFSHFDGATNQRLVEDAGLRIISAWEETVDEDGAPVTFLWVVARKP
jgi:hypothetical protein